MMGEGEDGWLNGPAYNNAGSLIALTQEGEDFTPSGDTYFSNNSKF